jgi:hypothetical protein
MKTLKRYYIQIFDCRNSYVIPLLIAVAAFMYVKLETSLFAPHVCLLEYLFQISCPLCNTTKSLEILFQGDIFKSIQISIVGISFIVYMVSLAIIKPLNKFHLLKIVDNLFLIVLFFNFLIQNLCQ